MFKKDEMEREIDSKSVTISYCFVEIILLLSVIISIVLKKNAIVPLYILITQILVKYISKLIIKKKYDDDRWGKLLIGLLIVVLIIIFFLTISVG